MSAAGRRPAPTTAGSRRAVALPVIAGLLLASALARIGGAQIADTAEGGNTAGEIGGMSGTGPACPGDPGLEDLLAALSARETELDARAERIEDRMQALTLAEAAATARLRALEAAEAALEQTLTLAEDAAEQDVQRLTAVYENMKPKTAAELFARMTPMFAAGFLGRMRPEAAAAILSGLEPDHAYAISATLAGRNAAAPVE